MQSLNPRALLLLTVCIILVIYLYFFYGVARSFKAEANANFEAEANSTSSEITLILNNAKDSLLNVIAMFVSDNHVNEKVLQGFIEKSQFFQKNKNIRAIAIGPLLKSDQLEIYNSALRKNSATRQALGYPEFKPVTLQSRDVAIPITLVESPGGRDGIVGFDMASSEARLKTARESIKSGSIVMTPPVKLSQDSSDAYPSVLLVGSSKDAKIEYLTKIPVDLNPIIIFAASFTPGAAIDQIISDKGSQLFDVNIVEVSNGKTTIYQGYTPNGDDPLRTDKLEFAGHEWSIEYYPSDQISSALPPWLYALFTAGILLLFGLAWSINALIKIRGSLKEQVAEQTQDLESAKRAADEARERAEEAQRIAKVGSWKLDLTANRLTWSDEAYRIYGCEPQAFTPTYDVFLDFVHPDDRAAVDEAYSRSVREGSDGDEIEHRIVLRNSDEVRYVHQRCVNKRDDEGIIIQSTGMVQDITERKQAEELLKVSEQRFRDISLASADWIWEVDANIRYTYASESVFAVLGFHSEEIIGKTPFDFMSPDETERVGGIFSAIAARKEAFYDLENINYHRDGSLRTLSTNGVPVLSEDGDLLGYRGMDRDITSQTRIDNLLNFIAQRGWSKDGQAFLPALAQTLGQMLRVNYVLIAQLSDESQQAQTMGLYAHGKVEPNLSYCLAGTPCANIIGKETCVYPQGIQQLFPEDSLLADMEAESYLGMPLWDASGQPIGLIAVVDTKPLDERDECLKLLNLVSAAASTELESLRYEKALRNERDRAQGYLDTVEAMIVALDPEGQIVRINRKACQLLGWQEAELLGENWFEKCLPSTQMTEASSAFAKVISGERGNKEYFENQLVTRSGDLLEVAWHSSVLRQDDGEIAGTLSAGEDVTARKKTDLALRRAQKMEAVGQLTGGIAHDFNNILGIIVGNLDLLKYQVFDDKALNQVETAKQSALRAADLIEKLLGFSRQQSEQRVHTDIRGVIGEMESLIARSLTPEIDVVQQFAEDLWQSEIDPGDFQDALLNLAINARDAMPGGGQLTLEARNCTLDPAYCAQDPGATPGEYVQLAVSDNGMGIAPENREKIFEPFFTTKPQGKGTGLGMAMVYGFIKRSKGYIQVYSEQDVGTTIRLYLPRAEGEEQPLESSTRSDEHLPRGHETILVVDDEVELLKLAQGSLQALGYRVLTASSGRQALERLAEEPGIDLLFSDVVMPGGMNGYELAEKATNTRPQLKVLLTSGYTGKALAHNGQARFATNLLSKPYSQVELAQGVRRLLGESGMSESDRREPVLPPVQPSAVSIEWTDALSIGIDAIDADHKTLLDLLNRSQKAMALDDSEQHTHIILNELSDYVRTHFQREEAVMAAVDYPGFENHRQVHELLLKQVEKKRGLLKRGELTIGDLVTSLHSWLIDHINNMDGAIKPYCEGKDDLIEEALEQAGIARNQENPS